VHQKKRKQTTFIPEKKKKLLGEISCWGEKRPSTKEKRVWVLGVKGGETKIRGA